MYTQRVVQSILTLKCKNWAFLTHFAMISHSNFNLFFNLFQLLGYCHGISELVTIRTMTVDDVSKDCQKILATDAS